MQNIAELEKRIECNAIEQGQLRDITTLAAELKQLIVRHNDALKEEGVRREMQQLENWLEEQRSGPAPACVISESGIAWLSGLRDRLKLSADENIRLESEGGTPQSKEQAQKTEELLKTVRRIDKIIDENATV